MISSEIRKSLLEFIKKHPEYATNSRLLEEAVAINPNIVLYADPKAITKEIALSAVSKDGWIFPYLPKQFREVHEIILEALKTTDYELMDDVDPSVLEDVEFMRQAVKINGAVYCYAKGEAATDKEIILNALKYSDLRKYVEMKANEQTKDPDVMAAMNKWQVSNRR